MSGLRAFGSCCFVSPVRASCCVVNIVPGRLYILRDVFVINHVICVVMRRDVCLVSCRLFLI